MLDTTNSSVIEPSLGVHQPCEFHLQAAQSALELQGVLLRYSVGLARSMSGSLIFKSTLQQVLEVLVKLTAAEAGSIFALNDEGMVVEAILARGPVIREQKESLAGKVLDQGLAGWVRQSNRVGLVNDTSHDDRWLELPDQPYKVGSALAVPFTRNRVCLSVLTLMHAQTNHFLPSWVAALERSLEPIALILENAKLHSQHSQTSFR